MSDIESEFSDYQSERDKEGGEHQGRSSPSRATLITIGIVLVLLAGGIVLLAMVGS